MNFSSLLKKTLIHALFHNKILLNINRRLLLFATWQLIIIIDYCIFDIKYLQDKIRGASVSQVNG